MFRWLAFGLVFVVGCQTARLRDVELVKDRILKLKPLSDYRSTVCELEVEPTEPARARFEEMFPGETKKLKADDWAFKWRQWESRCEIVPSGAARKSPVIREEQQFLASSLCILAQIFFVNSPFDELTYGPEDIQSMESGVRIGPQKSEVGIFLDRQDFNVTTRTKARGELSAQYKLVDGDWLPVQMIHSMTDYKIELSEIEYGDRVAGRRMPRSLLFSVGRERALAHSRVSIRNCSSL